MNYPPPRGHDFLTFLDTRIIFGNLSDGITTAFTKTVGPIGRM